MRQHRLTLYSLLIALALPQYPIFSGVFGASHLSEFGGVVPPWNHPVRGEDYNGKISPQSTNLCG
jgi:hypothetical protein